ncbi:relaxin-3-like [Dunckerocampus dactyliophorus]|uniref:relaxin-3-like n=1 Tax=Dunckerocampus dactyliophorus TaxID=161453 RepID=UPI002406DFC6|nr:relaxin-3-like [Dunckerocampus dactyliophorus]
MRSILLMAMLLLRVCRGTQAQVLDDTNTLRLCGRALLRAVVFTCGGSRWRRLIGEEAFRDGSAEPSVVKTRDEAPVLGRYWRDQDQVLIAACCQMGCRRRDLTMLC